MSGFRTMAPPNRAEGGQGKGVDKEALEKRRLAERKFGHQRWQDPGSVVECEPHGLAFASVEDRYQTGAAALLKEQRDAVIMERERKWERGRDVKLQREEQRWQAAQEEHIQNEVREQRMADGSKGSSNHQSVAYDPITLEYHPTQQGQRQKYEDELQRYKAGVRTETLHRRGAGDGYNPITGQELEPRPIPGKPRDVGGFNDRQGVSGGGSASGIRNNIW